MGGDGISLNPRPENWSIGSRPDGSESQGMIVAKIENAAAESPEDSDSQDEFGIQTLVDLFLDSVYRFAYRLTGSSQDAEDLVQETFLIAQQNLHQLRERRAALPWLFRILRSCRARNCRRLPVETSISVEEIVDSIPEEGELEEVDVARLLSLLEAMPDEYREPLLLFYFEELSYREIASALECPMGTVMSRISRGKSFLRSRLVPQSCGKEA